MSGDKPFLGYRSHDGIVYLYSEGWANDDAVILLELAAAWDPHAPSWTKAATPGALMLWAETGVPESFYHEGET